MTKRNTKVEKDSIYFLKLIVFFLLGCLWISYHANLTFPVGLAIGIILASHEHFMIDKKIEYAVLLVASLLSYVAPIGFVLNIG